jgi:TorA maturation chaperone TorD
VADPDTGQPASIEPEDRARANLYGIISRLFFAPADSNLIAEITSGGGEGNGSADAGGLVGAWRGLQEGCRSAFPAVVRQEYDSLFVGVGKSEVSLYLSGYAEPQGAERYVVRLREQLANWGLGRRQSVFEVEDHISGICDVVRWLIENGHSLEEQREFFESFAYPGVLPFCVALQNAPSASFYKRVAALTWSFFEVERAAFEMSGGE